MNSSNDSSIDLPKFIKDPMTILKETSRTFFIPISKLVPQIREAVASAYLCLRAIDEVEDHPTLPNSKKAKLLREVSMSLQTYSKATSDPQNIAQGWLLDDSLPEVSRRIGEWIFYCPVDIRPRVIEATVAMSDRMANWAEVNWKINNESDLDAYTFSVAGAVGILLSDLWAWFQGTQTDRELSLGFGRGLQAVNILRNHGEDHQRGVEFYPPGWQDEDMIEYARKNIQLGVKYVENLPKDSAALLFCQIPLNLALATIVVKQNGQEQLSRNEVGLVVDASDKNQSGDMLSNIQKLLNLNCQDN